MSKKNEVLTKSDYWSLALSERQLILLTVFTAALYYVFSLFSDGFYQHDEAAHFINMRTFWYQPDIILGNWAKPGYKLIYVIPALAGPLAVTVLNCLISAFTAYFVYKIARELQLKQAFFAFLLMASQPLWIQLVFRNYSEIPTAFLLSVALWFFFRKQWFWTSLVISYLTLLRQEFYVIGALFALYLLFEKQWKYIFLLAIFPLMIHIWGWIVTDDPLYLITSTMGTASAYKDAYPRLGFDHYFKMISTISGPLVILLVLLSFKFIWKEKWKPGFTLLAVSGIYFLIHCLFNWQSVKIGASTGGNLRYITVIAPSLSLLALYTIEKWFSAAKHETIDWLVAAAYVVITFLFLSYANNNIAFTAEVDIKPFVFTLGFAAILFFIPQKWIIQSLLMVQVLYLLAMVEPYKRSPEDVAVKQVVEWAQRNHLFDKPTMTQHTLFYYFTGKVQQEFSQKNYINITQETVDNAPKGTIIFWDSHYSYRPNLHPTSLPHTYFLEKPEEFKPLGQFISSDKRFGVIVFEKL